MSGTRAPILLAWSSGKDSAWSLHVLRQDPSVEVVGLLTTINEAYDRALLARLPRGVDPCGENGEFHTFAWAGPMFRRPVPVRSGEVVSRDGFVFADLLPAEAA